MNVKRSKTMKKCFYPAALMLMTAALFSCQKDDMLGADTPEAAESKITRTFVAESSDWTAPEARTSYDGQQVSLTGDEKIAVFFRYKDADETLSKLYGVSGKNNPELAEPQGDGTYSFTHAAIDGAKSYSYYFIMPYQQATVQLNTTGASAWVKLSPVQFPAKDSFDPGFDVLIGRPQLDVPVEESAKNFTVKGFKRMFAPFRLLVKDNAGELGSEKIRTATLSFSQTPVQAARQTLVGCFYIGLGDTYETTVFNSVEKNTMGNAVTALFPEGQEIVSGEGYPVWYDVNAVKFAAGTEVTLTVSTDTRTYSRTVALPSEQEVIVNRLNRLSFDLTGTGATKQQSVTQDFTTASLPDANGGARTLTASDGGSYEWTFAAGAKAAYPYTGDSGKSTHPHALRLNNGSVTLPAIPGKRITEVRVFTHVASATSSASLISLKDDSDTVIASGEYNYYTLAATGGMLSLKVPESNRSQALTLAGDSSANLVTAVTLMLEDDNAPRIAFEEPAVATETTLTFKAALTNADSWKYICKPTSEPAPTAVEVSESGTATNAVSVTIKDLNALTSYTLYGIATAADGTYGALASCTASTTAGDRTTDYWSRYENGEEIAVGDYKFSKTTMPDGILVSDAAGLARATLHNKGGVFFIDNKEVSEIDLTTSTILIKEPLILIGRYAGTDLAHTRIKIPTIQCADNVYIMNLDLAGQYAGTGVGYGFTKNNAQKDTDLFLIDCSLDYSGSGLRYIVNDNQTSSPRYGFGNVQIRNCIIRYNNQADNPMVFCLGAASDALEHITLRDCVIYASSMTRGYVVSCGDGNNANRPTPNLTITAENNTIYNIWNNNILFRGTSMPLIEVKNNVGYVDYADATLGNSNITSNSFTSLACIYFNGTDNYVASTVSVSGNYLYYSGEAVGNNKIPWNLIRSNNKATKEEGENTITEAVSPFRSVHPETGYFPIDSSVTAAGASYDTKTWIKWE